MMSVHRFPELVGKVVEGLCSSWNTRIVAKTKQGSEMSEVIFNKGLPQGDGLCRRLFTSCPNPVAWKLQSSESYRLSKPVSTKITDLLCIDDLKVFATSEKKLATVLKSTKLAMRDVGMECNEKKCSMTHIKRGALDQSTGNMKVDETAVIAKLKTGQH